MDEVEIAPQQMAWFDYRKDYSALSSDRVPFIAGYEAALRDLGMLPVDSYPTS